MSIHALRQLVEVVSTVEQVVERSPEPIPPDVGHRWGEPSSFKFTLPRGSDDDDDELPSPDPDDGGGVTVEWPGGGRPSRPRNEKLEFTGVITSPAYVKVRAPANLESWGIISVPDVITFTNVQTNPKLKVGKLTTIFELRFKLHPEGEASTPDG